MASSTTAPSSSMIPQPPRGKRDSKNRTTLINNATAHNNTSNAGANSNGNDQQTSNKVPKNALGGVYVTDEEIQNAFNFLDIDKAGKINMNSLRKSLGIFFPDIPLKELKFLMNDRRELTVNDLTELLKDNTIINYDPTAEAFKVRQ